MNSRETALEKPGITSSPLTPPRPPPQQLVQLSNRSCGRATFVRPICNCPDGPSGLTGGPCAPLSAHVVHRYPLEINLLLGYLAEENQKRKYLLTYSKHFDIYNTRTGFGYPSRKTWISIYTIQITDIHEWISIITQIILDILFNRFVFGYLILYICIYLVRLPIGIIPFRYLSAKVRGVKFPDLF